MFPDLWSGLTPEEPMPEPTIQIYESLYSLNQAFEQVVDQLKKLQRLASLEYAEGNIAALQEMRAGINHGVLEHLHTQELGNWKDYGEEKLEHDRKLAAIEAE